MDGNHENRRTPEGHRVLRPPQSLSFPRLFLGYPKVIPLWGGDFHEHMVVNIPGLTTTPPPRWNPRAMQECGRSTLKRTRPPMPMIMFLVLNSSGTLPHSDKHIDVSCPKEERQIHRHIHTNASSSRRPQPCRVGLMALCVKQHKDGQSGLELDCRNIHGRPLVRLLSSLPADKVQTYSTFGANVILFSVIILSSGAGVKKRISVYDTFIEGAKGASRPP